MISQNTGSLEWPEVSIPVRQGQMNFNNETQQNKE